jgi:TonB family protein
VDQVSKILLERERSQPMLLPWALIAILLHGGIVAAVFLMTRNASARPAQLPGVSVKIVRPEPPTRRSRRPPARQPTQVPPTETPPPEPVATALPEPDPQQQQPSEDAMPAPEQEATPKPTPSQSNAAGGTGGLSLGNGGDSRIPGIPSDFHFAYYVQRMLALIESRWYKPATAAGTSCRLRFTINREGRLSRIELESSSGNSSFDRAALRALYAANPLPPLPPGYAKSTLTVHLTFSE